MNIFRTKNDLAVAIPRLVLGIVFFPHGAQKLLGWFGGSGFTGTVRYFESHGMPAIFAFLAMGVEFFGSLGLILGFLGRIAACSIALNMLVAIATNRARNGFLMNWMGDKTGEGLEFRLLVLGIAVMVMIAGSGAASLDWIIYKNKSYSSLSRPA